MSDLKDLVISHEEKGRPCCGDIDECTETIRAGRMLFHAITDRLCNGGTEADGGKGAERLDEALAAWVKADPAVSKYYR